MERPETCTCDLAPCVPNKRSPQGACGRFGRRKHDETPHTYNRRYYRPHCACWQSGDVCCFCDAPACTCGV